MKKLYYDVSKCLGCKSCEIACAIGKSATKDLFKALSESTPPQSRVKVGVSGGKCFPIACRHCKEHPCVSACIAAALTYDEKTDRVLHNKDKCIGCWMCVMVCPYGAIRDDKNLKIPIRCDLCADLADGDEPASPNRGEPRCVKACPVGAIMFLEEEEFDKLAGKKVK